MLRAGHLARHSEHHWMKLTSILESIIVLHGDSNPTTLPYIIVGFQYYQESSDPRFLQRYPTSAT